MKRVLLYSAVLFSLLSCKPKIPYTETMRLDLKHRYVKDQKAQDYDLKKVARKEYCDSMEVAFNKLCDENALVVKKYFNEYGYPGIKENGKEASLQFWLLVQHADNDVLFQKKVLKAMKKELQSNNVNRQNYAYLFDRVKKNENKPQLYGNQMVWDSMGVHTPYRLKYPDKLQQLRAEMELQPMEEYLKLFNEQ